MRKYQRIWLAIKEAGVGKEIPVRCHETAASTLIQAVRKEKTQDVAIRRKIGMLTEGRMVDRTEKDGSRDGFVIIYFKLLWSERLKDI